ncbi:MAG: Maf family nucleotide pyrophosphatase [Chloroflexota bacterium]
MSEKPPLVLKLEGLGRLGGAIATHNGTKVYVFGGIPGEEVLAEVVNHQRNRMAARVLHVSVPSPHRVAVPCPYFGQCTGCQWQHIHYDHQLAIKRSMVEQAFTRPGGIPDAPVAAVVPAPGTLGYRNHARFTVGPQGALGFVNRETRSFVRIETCLLMHPWINEALAQLQGRCAETTQLSIRYGVNTGQWLIQPSLKAADIPLQSGQKHYEEVLHGHRFRISAASFFQVNSVQAAHMADLALQRLSLTGEQTVVDAYAGVATFAVLIAPHARQVIAIEESASAIKDAAVNVEGLENVQLVQAKTEDVLQRLPQPVDALVLDPPRQGCHPAVLKAILSSPPKRIVYVSCDPQALARDVGILTHGPYHLDQVLPIDLFPQTHHIECLATLSYTPERAAAFRGRQDLVLASASPRRQEIMAAMGLSFHSIPSQTDDTPPHKGDPTVVARTQALEKARAVASTRSTGTVIGADTVVADGDTLMGKPTSEDEARQMLRILRAKQHQVVTGVALVDAATGEELTSYRLSHVRMRDYSDEEIATYVNAGRAWDKAGAYGVQDQDFHPASRVTGCYLNVVGLPPCTVMKLLNRMGIFPRIDPDWVPPRGCRHCHRLAKEAARG